MAYRQGLEELFASNIWKNTEDSLRNNPRDRNKIYNEQKKLIDRIKNSVVKYYAVELLHPDILEYHGVDDKRTLDAFAKMYTTQRKEYFLEYNKLQEDLR